MDAKSVSIALESFALVMSAMLLVSHLIMPSSGRQNRRDELFTAMLTTNIVALVCDLTTWVLESARYTLLLYAANSVVFGAGYVVAGLFTGYLSSFVTQRTPRDQRLLHMIYINCNIAVVLVVLSLFGHWYFFIEDGLIEAGSMAWFALAYSLAIMVMDMVFVLLHHKEIGTPHTVAFLGYGAVPLITFIVQLLGTEVTVTWLGSTLTMLLIYLVVHIDSVRQLREQELELAKAQSTLVLSQIRPHFLFNALNCIYHLCDTDPKKAQEAVGEFSDYLRENLSALDRPEPVPFEAELAHVKHYLALEEMRFGDALRVEYRVTASNFTLPALTVQPLVENAVKHGLDSTSKGVTITIGTSEYEDHYEILIRDDGAGFDAERFFAGQNAAHDASHAPPNLAGERDHVGLKNVAARLRYTCGGTLEVTSSPGRGTTAKIEIPKAPYTGGG